MLVTKPTISIKINPNIEYNIEYNIELDEGFTAKKVAVYYKST